MLMGQCNGCGKGIPQGYVPYVTRWESVEHAGQYHIMRPVEMYCHGCREEAALNERKHRRKRQQAAVMPETVVNKMEPKEIAVRLLLVMSREAAMGSRKLAKLAELEYTPLILAVLKRLHQAGKVRFVEGRWLRR